MVKALFLDRDGILIEDVSYPHKIGDLQIKSGIIPYLIRFMEYGFKLIIITNQAGIAKGRFTLDQYNVFQQELEERLMDRGVVITSTYFCPYHKDGVIAPYNRDSNDRKPKPGMVYKAVEDHGINLEKSFMIGDKVSDNIEIELLKCYILESDYNRGVSGTYSTIDEIFREIESAL